MNTRDRLLFAYLLLIMALISINGVYMTEPGGLPSIGWAGMTAVALVGAIIMLSRATWSWFSTRRGEAA